MRPSAESRGFAWVLVDIVATKDTYARNTVVPMPVRRLRRDGARGVDPLCPYDTLRAAWDARVHAVPVSERTHGRPSSSPFFTSGDGMEAWSSITSREVARRMATACGENPEDFGAKCWRIGAATDLRDVLGDGSRAMIKQRGRWASDVAEVYQRALVDRQLDASARVANARGVDMEALVEGWSQPSSFR
eukprot:5446363-Pleurochrysis_carterae.AAC.1